MFVGSMVAIVTPFHHDGTIDFEAFGLLIDMHVQAGTQAIIVAGTTGESATLTQDEKRELIQFAVDRVAERLPVIAGTGDCSTHHTIELSRMAMELGADAVLIMTPPYIKPTQQGLFEHFQKIAEAVAIPIILYNVPGRTAGDLLPETVARLAHISNIIGIKEATADVERARQIIAECGEKLDVYSGDDITALELIKIGAKGVISVTANVAPAQVHAMIAACLDGNFKLAEDLDKNLQPLHKAMFYESNPIPCKWALYEMGMLQNALRLPLTPLDEKYREPLRQVLRGSDIKLTRRAA